MEARLDNLVKRLEKLEEKLDILLADPHSKEWFCDLCGSSSDVRYSCTKCSRTETRSAPWLGSDKKLKLQVTTDICSNCWQAELDLPTECSHSREDYYVTIIM